MSKQTNTNRVCGKTIEIFIMNLFNCTTKVDYIITCNNLWKLKSFYKFMDFVTTSVKQAYLDLPIFF